MKKLMFSTSDSYAPLAVRVLLALVLFPHGAQKLLGWFGGFGFSGTMGFFTGTAGLPWPVGFAVILIEFFGPLALLFGLATRFWSLAILGVACGIVQTSHHDYFFMNWFGSQKAEGVEFFLLMIGMAISLIISGSGALSLDAAISRRSAFFSPNRKAALSAAMMLVAGLLLSTGCKKDSSSDPSPANGAPHTNPVPAGLSGQWNMTYSGSGYLYDGYHYGNSGRGINVNIKADGIGWWNEIWQQATPSCVLVQNLSIDVAYELRTEAGTPMLYIYTTGGNYHSEGCTTVTDFVLGLDEIYPAFAPYKYYYKLDAVDGDPLQPVLVLSQEADEAKRFHRAEDETMNVLKKQ